MCHTLLKKVKPNQNSGNPTPNGNAIVIPPANIRRVPLFLGFLGSPQIVSVYQGSTPPTTTPAQKKIIQQTHVEASYVVLYPTHC